MLLVWFLFQGRNDKTKLVNVLQLFSSTPLLWLQFHQLFLWSDHHIQTIEIWLDNFVMNKILAKIKMFWMMRNAKYVYLNILLSQIQICSLSGYHVSALIWQKYLGYC